MRLLVSFLYGRVAKEMKRGEFAQKCKDVHCYLSSMEPYATWFNSAEHEIRELKRGTTRKVTQSGAPQLDGHVPERVLSSETADISLFCKFSFWG
eukprot:CCRYP_015109-RA/>CCRYP_015109-RA protein AED:0.57 eAED:0.44 QI:0/0/0/1/0/0/2/0/94